MKTRNLIYRNRESIIKNAIIWILVFTLVTLPFGFEIGTALVIPLIIPVHVNFYLVDRYYKKKLYIRYFLLAGLLVFVFGVFAQGLSSNIILTNIDHEFIRSINDDIIHITESPILRFAFNPLIVVLLTTLYRNIQEKQKNAMQELETQRLKSELDFLKGQVNPHFLFNVLNNLFSMSTAYGDEATANGIGHLSHLMRYMIYDTNSEYVRLENEVDMLENFIDLQKLRLDESTHENVQMIVNGEITKKHIPPMLLISFVENAFKHGYSLNKPFYIKIELIIDDVNLNFKVENSINKVRKNKNMDSSGIGLENVRKRLDLLYKDQYLLEINETRDNHLINLKIPFKS